MSNPDLQVERVCTVHAVLDRNGLVNVYRHRQTYKVKGTPLSRPIHPNELWCADYKGEFMLADRLFLIELVSVALPCKGPAATPPLFHIRPVPCPRLHKARFP